MFLPIRAYSHNSTYDGSNGYYKSPISFHGGVEQVKSTSLTSTTRDGFHSASNEGRHKNDLIHGVEQIYPINNRLPPLIEQTRCPKHLYVSQENLTLHTK
jgi:hypothetical protein